MLFEVYIFAIRVIIIIKKEKIYDCNKHEGEKKKKERNIGIKKNKSRRIYIKTKKENDIKECIDQRTEEMKEGRKESKR